ncbi:hypothetical protein NQ317_016554 [Molorchus minor]|uniref:MADF domain-containing protein n=1 Tax=Molorchus minor TaxID=1323400 RepID=A0ABQ9IZI7_9CUCU|nr:hypothetical protein NQ317_016554 [Molorchus minor]
MYRDRVKKQKALKFIAEKFDATEAEIQRKLHNLRTQENQEWNKMKKRKSGQGTDDTYNSSWEYFESLKFLVDQNMASGTEDNLLVRGIDCDYSRNDPSPLDLSRTLPKPKTTVFGVFSYIFMSKESIATIPEVDPSTPDFVRIFPILCDQSIATIPETILALPILPELSRSLKPP